MRHCVKKVRSELLEAPWFVMDFVKVGVGQDSLPWTTEEVRRVMRAKITFERSSGKQGTPWIGSALGSYIIWLRGS